MIKIIGPCGLTKFSQRYSANANLDSLKVDGIHHCALKKRHGGVVSLQEAFQL